MKKLLSIILALTFCLAAFSALAPTVSAKAATISRKEAEELVIKASEFFYDARVEGYNDEMVDRKSEDRRKVHLPEYNIDVTYLPVYESKLPGGSYAAMCEMLEDSQIIDLLTNPDEFAPSPDTGDSVVDTLALCLGGMAIVMSALCLVRRRREF